MKESGNMITFMVKADMYLMAKQSEKVNGKKVVFKVDLNILFTKLQL